MPRLNTICNMSFACSLINEARDFNSLVPLARACPNWTFDGAIGLATTSSFMLRIGFWEVAELVGLTAKLTSGRCQGNSTEACGNRNGGRFAHTAVANCQSACVSNLKLRNVRRDPLSGDASKSGTSANTVEVHSARGCYELAMA